MTTFAGDSMAIATAFIRAEARSHRSAIAAGTLAGISLVTVGIAAGPDLTQLRRMAPALVWISLLASGLAIADRLDQVDRRDDAFSALWLALDDRRALFVGRFLALAVAIIGLQAAIWSMAVILLDVPVGRGALGLIPLTLATSGGLAGAAVIAVSLAGGSRERTLLLPVVLLPLTVPTLIAGVQASTALLADAAAEGLAWTAVAAIEAVLLAGLGLLVFEPMAAPD
jgi:heme exporter protein B